MIPELPGAPHRRRPRYRGKHPRRFEEKYKERQPQRYPETVAKVVASGKTPAGSHRPIMVEEILAALSPQSGEIGVDCTLGYGGHAAALLPKLLPGGRLIGLDVDGVELPKTEARLRGFGFGEEVLIVRRSNFAGLPQVLAALGISAVDLVLADLGVSSMQLDDPTRGFGIKGDGPLDMRMNPERGRPASTLLERISPQALAELLSAHSDEPRSGLLGEALAGRSFATTRLLTAAVRTALGKLSEDEVELALRRVFQALRIAVNDEFSALESLLRWLPSCLSPGGRVAVLSFHSGEDRRVKQAFRRGFDEGVYARVADEVQRPSADERRANPRSASAKLRWAQRA